MKVTMRFYGSLKALAGARETTIDVPVSTGLGDLPKVLKEHFGDELFRLVANQRPFSGLRVLVNGRDSFTLNGLQTILADGDTVTVLPPIAGG